MSTAKDVLNSLQAVNGEVALAIQIGTVLFPIAKGAITEIRSISTGVETVKYAVLIETDEAELDSIEKLSTDDLTAINSELEKLGATAVPVPPADKPPSST